MTAISNGSGFIVRSDGLVLTNAHVVANKAEVNVKLPDGRTLKGVVQAVDQISDLATIRMFGEVSILLIFFFQPCKPLQCIILHSYNYCLISDTKRCVL